MSKELTTKEVKEHEHQPSIVGNADWLRAGGVKFDTECTVEGCEARGWTVWYSEPEMEWYE